MSRFLFDISDIVQFAQHNSRVSGIQRVQLGLLKNISEMGQGAELSGVFFLKSDPTLYEFSLRDFLPDMEYHGAVLLHRLGLARSRGKIPDKYQVRKYLRDFKSNKFMRLLRRVDLYISALFFKRRFARTGLRRAGYEFPCVHPIPVTKRAVQQQDVLVFLGGSWSIPGAIACARKHRASGGRVIQLVHDVIPHYFPQYCTEGMTREYNAWLKQMGGYVTDVICISECTAKDFLRLNLPGFSERNVKVVPLAHEMMGYSRNHRGAHAGAQERRAIDGEFVLAVGTIEVRKNAILLLKIWRKLIDTDPLSAPKLVFAGKRGWHVDEFERMMRERPDLSSRIVIVDSPSDSVLARLYEDCLFTIFPSFYEGWGLPVGESAWFGKYCLASNTSSVPEVCGDLIDYLDPADEEEGYRAVTKVLRDRDYLRSREQVISRAPLRGWQDVAQDMWSKINS